MSDNAFARLRPLTAAVSRAVTPRRALAVALVLLAAVLALRPPPDGAEETAPMLVAVRPLAPGTGLSPDDVRVVRAPPELRPAGTLGDPTEVTGHVLAGAVGDGEPITRTRLVGAENTLLTGGPGTVAVPVRLADPAVAGLLRPGTRVDVIGVGAEVVAEDAAVVTVRPGRADGTDGLVLLALPRPAATRAAAVSLERPVTVTLR